MPRENQAELFVRLLFESLEAHRLVQKLHFNTAPRALSNRRTRAFDKFLALPGGAVAPMDCVEMMSHPYETRLVLN